MDYRDYQKSRDLAWEVLINEGVRELPVRVTALCRQMGIYVHEFVPEREDMSDGFTMMIHGSPHIFISSACSVQRQRFTAAHELGHVLLGHIGKYQLVNREPSREDSPIEQSANVFAARILAPACVLWALDARTPEQIAKLCQISYQAASFRAERMELLYQRNKFLSSPLERSVYQQFAGYIDRMRQEH